MNGAASPPLATHHATDYVPSNMNREMFCVYRQDDNGQVFEVRHSIDQTSAEALRDQLAGRAHKQTYWIEPTVHCLEGRTKQGRTIG